MRNVPSRSEVSRHAVYTSEGEILCGFNAGKNERLPDVKPVLDIRGRCRLQELRESRWGVANEDIRVTFKDLVAERV